MGALPAIKAAERILEIIVDLEPEEITKALEAIGKAGATYGTVWGAGDPHRSRMDLDFYELKGEVLQFCQKIKDDRRYGVAFATVLLHRENIARGLIDNKGDKGRDRTPQI